MGISDKTKKLAGSSKFIVKMKGMWPFVKPIFPKVVLGLLLTIPVGMLDALIALFLKPYMDNVMVAKESSNFIYVPFVIVGFTIVQGVFNFLAVYVNGWTANKITLNIKRVLFEKLLSLSPAFFDKTTSGSVFFRFSKDAETASNGLINNVKTIVTRVFSIVSLVAVLLYNSWQLTIISIFVLGCAFLPLYFVKKRMKMVFEKSVSVESDLVTVYNEAFAGNKTITSYNLQNLKMENFDGLLGKSFNLKMALLKNTSWLSPVMHIISSFGVAGVVFFGTYLVINDTITSGNFVSFLAALIMLYTPVKSIGQQFVSIQGSFMAMDRMFKMLDLKPSVRDAEDRTPVELKGFNKEIIFDKVSFGYDNFKIVLKEISFTVKKGETVALVGNSGGGKTTLINLLMRLYNLKSGNIIIDGHKLWQLSLKSLREQIAIVFQDNFLFSGTIRENIMLGNPNAGEEELSRAVDMACLGEVVAGFERGLDTVIGERGIILSGGQKQRVAVARAILKNAPIVILDEATSALDNKSEKELQKAFDNLMKDKTIFVIAHRLSTVQHADKILVLDNGKIVEIGTHDELLATENGVYKQLYQIQFKA
ncbi:MAG: ABC transporter ATP-binding protein/permease [Endomicrobium sp.]|jgi:subfamily B ATP-binding cassette protein MsbA|nr:ABC transporter ATP-binding protein/permease [Endomicrobium sp.]